MKKTAHGARGLQPLPPPPRIFQIAIFGGKIRYQFILITSFQCYFNLKEWNNFCVNPGNHYFLFLFFLLVSFQLLICGCRGQTSSVQLLLSSVLLSDYPVMANSGEVRTFKSAQLAWGFQEGHLLRSTMQLKICFALFLIFFFPHYFMNVCPIIMRGCRNPKWNGVETKKVLINLMILIMYSVITRGW